MYISIYTYTATYFHGPLLLLCLSTLNFYRCFMRLLGPSPIQKKFTA